MQFFYYKFPFYNCDDENFQCLLELISEYYRSYNVFIWRNTIEGALITGENLPEFLGYMETILRPERMDKIRDFLQMHEDSLRLCLKADFRELYIVLDKIGKMVTPE